MTDQLTLADAALLSRVLGHEIEPGLVRTLGPSTLAAIIQAARSEGHHPESGEWVMVPREPTEAMLVNGREALLPVCTRDRLATYGPVRAVWDDMIASSPPPKGAGAGTLSIETAPRDCEIDVYVTGSGSRWIENCRWGKPTGANWGDRYGDDQDLPEQWITRAGFALDRRNGVATHWRPADGALGRQDEVAPQPRDEPISSSKGEALPVVITDEMVKAGAVAMMPDAFGDSEREWAQSIRDTLIARSRACLTAALLSRGEG